MIVRDEEDLLDEALESIGDLVDRIEIVDTGSVDRTVEIALEHGAHVSQAIWRDDFAWARNQVVSGCRDARFVLIVDADERLICPDPEVTRRLLESLPAGLYGINCEVRDMDEGRLVSAQPARRIVTDGGPSGEVPSMSCSSSPRDTPSSNWIRPPLPSNTLG
ncbi:MAG: glycosyltransferase [Actinomycetia bacterium]|nr:glycosyltransferase [Actinomycetes bacterium]